MRASLWVLASGDGLARARGMANEGDSERGAFVKARATQELLAFLDVYSPGMTELIRQRVPPEPLARLEAAMPAAWIPIDDARFVIEAVVDEVGGQAPELWRRYMSQHFVRAAWLRTFVEGMIRILGLSPATMIRMIERGWSTTYKGFARLEASSIGDGTATVVMHSVEDRLFEFPAYHQVFKGVFLGALDVASAKGRVDFTVDERDGTVTYEIYWSR